MSPGVWDQTQATSPGDVEEYERRNFVVLLSEPEVEFESDRPREWEGACYFDVLLHAGRIKKRGTGKETPVEPGAPVKATIGTRSRSLLGTLKAMEPLSKAGRIRVETRKSKEGRTYYVAVKAKPKKPKRAKAPKASEGPEAEAGKEPPAEATAPGTLPGTTPEAKPEEKPQPRDPSSETVVASDGTLWKWHGQEGMGAGA